MINMYGSNKLFLRVFRQNYLNILSSIFPGVSLETLPRSSLISTSNYQNNKEGMLKAHLYKQFFF